MTKMKINKISNRTSYSTNVQYTICLLLTKLIWIFHTDENSVDPDLLEEASR